MKQYEISILGNRVMIKTIGKNLNKVTYMKFKDGLKTINKMKENNFNINISQEAKIILNI